jgi:prophage tail gpP-like protein
VKNLAKSIGYLPCNSVQTSVSNQEIIPATPTNWTVKYYIKKISLYNIQECTLIFEDRLGIHEQILFAGQGFHMSYEDPEITSLKIKENNIQYTYLMVY